MGWLMRIALMSVCLFILQIGKALILNHRSKSKYRDIPSLPRHWLWGNILNAGSRFDHTGKRHPDYGFQKVWEELGRPSHFLFDLAPFGHTYLVACTPAIAEQFVQRSLTFPYSAPKSDTLKPLRPLVGRDSILTLESKRWREARNGLAPILSHRNRREMQSVIIGKVTCLVERLATAAEQGAMVTLRDFSQDLTTDIIFYLTTGRDPDIQGTRPGHGMKRKRGLVTAFRKLSTLALKDTGSIPLGSFDIIRLVRVWYYERIVDREICHMLEVHDAGRKEKNHLTGFVSLLDVSKEWHQGRQVQDLVSHVKTLLFAGQDTGAALIQWMGYELSRAHASIIDTLRQEHEAVFGPSHHSALEFLADQHRPDSALGGKLPYTDAFIKETLRLYPPGSTARMVPENQGKPFLKVGEQAVDVAGLRVYICHRIIHHNPEVFSSDAQEFRPDRWLDLEYVSGLPLGAWRPFERGPRACAGMDLALFEAKAVLCAIARKFRFEKVDSPGDNGEGVFVAHDIISVPSDGMTMKVHFS